MINWNDFPPEDSAKKLKILRADHTRLTKCIVLSERACGVYGHWVPSLKRNLPCTCPYECHCDKEQCERWWRAYLGVWDGRAVRVAEIPSAAWIAAEGVKWQENRPGLRGLMLTLDRKPRVKTGQVHATFAEPSAPVDVAKLPPGPAIKEELQRIWYSQP